MRFGHVYQDRKDIQVAVFDRGRPHIDVMIDSTGYASFASLFPPSLCFLRTDEIDRVIVAINAWLEFATDELDELVVGFLFDEIMGSHLGCEDMDPSLYLVLCAREDLTIGWRVSIGKKIRGRKPSNINVKEEEL